MVFKIDLDKWRPCPDKDCTIVLFYPRQNIYFQSQGNIFLFLALLKTLSSHLCSSPLFTAVDSGIALESLRSVPEEGAKMETSSVLQNGVKTPE